MAARAGLIRVGGRTERIRQAVVDAARELLERGDTDLSPARLSEASGVHKTTIYRRWPTREVLLQEIMKYRSSTLVIRPSDDWEKYLANLARKLNDFLSSPGELALLKTLIHADATYAEEVRTVWLPLAETLAQPIVAAQTRGEVAPHVDATEVVRTLIGLIISEALFTRVKPSRQMLANVVRYLCDGIRTTNQASVAGV